MEVVEVIAAELAIRHAVTQHVIRDYQDAVGHGDDGLLVPAALDQPAVLSREVAVAFAHGAPGTLHEGLAQDPVREAGAAAQALAGTLVVARAEARPGGRMARGGKAAHVTAEFRDDRLRGAAGHPRDGVEARDRVGLGGGARRDAAITGRDGLVEELDVAQELGEQEAVMGRDAPSERLGERRAFAPQAPLGQLRQLRGGTRAGDQRLQHRARRYPEHRGDYAPELDVRRLEDLQDTVRLPGPLLDQPLAVAHHVAQLALRRG